MNIQSNRLSNATQSSEFNPKDKKESFSKDTVPTKESTKPIKKDEYVPSQPIETVTYENPNKSSSTKSIEQLKLESEQAHNQLKELVQKMLSAQGIKANQLSPDSLVTIDPETRIAAQNAIGEGGEHSPEKVSDRIVDFAIAISGGDKTKLNTLIQAIDKGFSEAARTFGGQLPDISHRTYDMIREKLDKWSNEEAVDPI